MCIQVVQKNKVRLPIYLPIWFLVQLLVGFGSSFIFRIHWLPRFVLSLVSLVDGNERKCLWVAPPLWLFEVLNRVEIFEFLEELVSFNFDNTQLVSGMIKKKKICTVIVIFKVDHYYWCANTYLSKNIIREAFFIDLLWCDIAFFIAFLQLCCLLHFIVSIIAVICFISFKTCWLYFFNHFYLFLLLCFALNFPEFCLYFFLFIVKGDKYVNK